jgi:hypothetical protein
MEMRDTDRMTRTKLLGGALVFTFLLLFFSAVAGATILTPSGVAMPIPAGTETGTLVATATGSYNTIDSADGIVTEGVYSETSATSSVCPVGQTCLDFVYQFTDTMTLRPVFDFQAADFDNVLQWTTDVSQSATNTGALSIFSVPTATPPGTPLGITTVRANRTGMGPDQPSLAGGDDVRFAMGGLGTVGESNIFIIKTNAPKYIVGNVLLIGSDVVSSPVPPGNAPWSARYPGSGIWTPIANTNTASFAFNGVGYTNTFLGPTVPEPGFYGVLAIGLAGLFLAVKYRRGKQSA